MCALRLATCSMSVCALMLQVAICLGQADTPVELTWEAPENCAQQAQVQQRLRALIGSSDENTNPFKLTEPSRPSVNVTA